MSQAVDRRRLKRYAKRIQAAFVSGPLNGEGHIKNLCKEGLFLRSERLPSPGAEVRVLIKPEDGRKIEVTGVVRWTTEQIPGREPQPGFGVLIESPTDEFLELFEELLLN